MKDQIKRNHDDLLEVNRQILELKTQLILLNARKEELIREHNEIIMELQLQLAQKERRQ